MQKAHTSRAHKPLVLAMAIAAIGLTACGGSDNKSSSDTGLKKVFNCTDSNVQGARVICIGSANDLSDQAVQDELIDALTEAQTGDTFVLPQGRYAFNATISYSGQTDGLKVTDLTFRGAGMDKTIIDASGVSGDGFLIQYTDNLIFEDFAIYESNNNALKVIQSDGVIMRRMATVWETDYQSTNGAYGLYPVQTSNVLIEDCYVKGSADAGIYVGQSDKIVVRNNIAEKNVAGIEIENSTEADVYGNTARGNTGGILIFDLPIGSGKYGSGVRVFDNLVDANNAPNFANVGTFAGGVHIVPPGTGVIVLSTSDVEIYNNTIKDHQTTSVAITSYLLADETVAAAPNLNVGTEVTSYEDIHPHSKAIMDGWSPLVRNINIHNNSISLAAGLNNPQGDLIEDLINGYNAFHNMQPDIASGKTTVPHILYDGVGELLANTPNPDGEGESILYAIAGGINQVAAAVKANIPGAPDYTPIDLDKFAPYATDGGVCQSDNGIDGQNLFAASVYETSATAGTFVDGSPLTKLEQLSGNLSLAGAIMADPSGVMDCASGYEGSPATVTFNAQTFGCTADDSEKPSCAL
ncbi:parallel beta-helix domain-containing protein [Thalassolituus hydrocarboniclasticus]|uniref:Right-handed parallel beta-helix repeat-containing protein n=1 Tax=Thalassolituus hydrocarboniclasticus TaxID=2742796 RepID=A0ABY6A9G5_9GAMM|nr:parallel beta-helix domain-containing protein [Thalassolituus hydrocarboniclasticus]UXD87312.1 right-handed parallel beta-helix repeat-containing protein [Thalassolituus hydrocarboniclasticus]